MLRPRHYFADILKHPRKEWKGLLEKVPQVHKKAVRQYLELHEERRRFEQRARTNRSTA